MLAIKKLSRRFHRCGAGLVWLLLLNGCAPPGPRALLDGDRLIREGKYAQAIQRLETARGSMEQDPRLWHWLGLAYQGAGDAPRAVEAYQKALALDRSNLVSVAHYNLGCLYLDQTNPVAAANELRSYCMLSNSLPALLKLGQAELRSRQIDAAERTFNSVLRSRPNDAAALNGLGLASAQRGRLRDAAAHFQNALHADPKHGPALLNLAVLYQQQPGQHAYAAQKYHEYLALEPRPANYDAVLAISQRLDQDLAPPPPAPTNHLSSTAVKTNPVVLSTNPAPAVSNLVRTIPPPVVTQRVVQATTNVLKPATNLARATVLTNTPPLLVTQRPPAVVSAPLLQTNHPVPPPLTLSSQLSTLNSTSSPAPRPVTPTPPPVVVTEVTLPETIPAKTAQDPLPSTAPILNSNPPSPPSRTSALSLQPSATPSPATGTVSVASTSRSKPPKKGFFQKLNPFGGKSKTTSGSAPADPVSPLKTNELRPSATAEASATASNQLVALTLKETPSKPEILRYSYLAPAKPQPGDRKAAEIFFSKGLKAHQAKHTDAAITAYRAALEKDPSYFEACYNLSLIALQVTDWKAALAASEQALAIDPTNANARFTLAQALEQANYPLDAANEYEQVILSKPDEVRAHLALANLFAQKLAEPDRARAHYMKVLELDPRHPRANEIRYWLAANP